MILRYLSAILLAAVSFYTASLYESTAMALLGFAQVFLIIVSFVYLLYEKASLAVTLEMLPVLTDRKEPVYVRVTVRQRRRGCYGRIKVQAAVKRERGGVSRRRWLQEESGSPAAGGKAGRPEERELSGMLTVARAGSYEIRLKRVRLYDMTGLFCIDYGRALRGQKSVLAVLPTVSPVGVKLSGAVRNFVGEAEVYDTQRSGEDAGETLHLRPFQDGDKLRSIHWKLSAKTDGLVVRVDSMPRGCPVAILADPGGRVEDALMQCVASLSFSLLEWECPHYVAWYSGYRQDVTRMRVDSEESFYEALLHLMREQGSRNSPDIGRCYREKYSGEPVLHCVRVGAAPCFQVDMQDPLYLDRTELERELGKLELLL